MLTLLLCSLLLLCVFCVMGMGGGRKRTAGGLSRWSVGVLLLVSGAAQADLVATVSLASGAAGTIAPGETTTLRVRSFFHSHSNCRDSNRGNQNGEIDRFIFRGNAEQKKSG